MFLVCNLRFSPTIDWVLRPVLPGVKRPGSEADHSRPSSAEVKNKWSCTSTSGDEIKDNDMGGALEHMGHKRVAHWVMVGNPDGKSPLGRPKCRWENDIKMDF